MKKSKEILLESTLLNNKFLRIYLQSVITVFGLLIWISIAKYIYLHQDLYGIWSFRSNDPPWMPPGVSAIPIFGEHFFGDFQLPYGLANTEYAYGNAYNPTLPLGFLFFEFLGLFPLKVSFLIFICINLFSFFVTVRKISVGNSELSKILPFILTLTSLPIFIAFDRGALVFLTIVLFLISFQYFQTEKREKEKLKYWANILLLSIVLSWKPYLSLIVLLNYKRIKIKTFFVIICSCVILNLISLVIFFRPILGSIKGIINSYNLQLGSQGSDWLYSGVSINKFILAIHYYLNGSLSDNAFLAKMSKYSLLIGIAYILITVFFNTFIFRSNSTRLAMSLSVISFVVPVSMAYTLTWTFFAILLILSDTFENKFSFSNREQVSRMMLLAGISMLSLPWPTMYYLTLIPGIWIATLTSILLFNFYSSVKSRLSHG